MGLEGAKRYTAGFSLVEFHFPLPSPFVTVGAPVPARLTLHHSKLELKQYLPCGDPLVQAAFWFDPPLKNSPAPTLVLRSSIHPLLSADRDRTNMEYWCSLFFVADA